MQRLYASPSDAPHEKTEHCAGCDAYYLASEVDARIAELEKALVDLVTGHNGYSKGLGPCICAAHEEARRVLGMTRDDVHPARTL